MGIIRCLLVLGLSTTPAATSLADIVADSVADFGGVQGGGGWHYGYIDPAQGPDFLPFPSFGPHAGSPPAGEEPAWFIEYFGEPILAPTPYTHLTASGGHPNTGGPGVGPVHYTVRRWVSEVAGEITISGLFGDYSPDFGTPGVMDGVTGQILVDGTAIWTLTTTGIAADSPYSVTASVARGSVVDFVLQPNANQESDSYTWTVVVDAACRADWNGDATVNSADISAFLTDWIASVTAGTLVADYSGNGVVNSNDISTYLTAWLEAITTGC